MPHPSSHLRPAAGPTPPDPAWAVWSRAWTRHLPTLTGRHDLTVTVAPGAGGGAPACYHPAAATIEIDATHIGDPTVTDPRRATHKRLVPTAYGLLVHEAAHAAHSRWHTPPATPPVVAHVADLLEESRAEARQRTRRRGDRRWLRHTVTTLITGDEAPVDDAWHAAGLAGLLLARVDARILTTKDVRAVRAAVTTVLGRARLSRLREIWRQAHTVADTDADTMLDLAWRWCRILDINPHTQPETPHADEGVFPGRLAAALADHLAATAGLTTTEHTARRDAAAHTPPTHWTRRDPTADEHAAARHLANRLRQARTHHPEPDRRPSQLPPGRLRTRAAITADAQRAAGTIPTAAPWQRPTHQPPDKPTLHLGILVDVSGSMTEFAEPLSSAAWILAHAAHRNHAVTTTIAFGDTVTLLVPPHHHPTHVQQMQALDGTEQFPDAVKLADRLLGLRHRRTLRLLAVVSDGWFSDRIPAAQKLITTLHHAGCPILWLHPDDTPAHTYTHTTTIPVHHPTDAITHIADAALAAIRTA